MNAIATVALGLGIGNFIIVMIHAWPHSPMFGKGKHQR